MKLPECFRLATHKHRVIQGSSVRISNMATIQDLRFRPPAIPLLLGDPYLQTWIFGDNVTEPIRHWTGIAKDTLGLVRVDGRTYRFLGSCHTAPATQPGPVVNLTNSNLAPSGCDIDHTDDAGDAECNLRCYSDPDCVAYVRGGDPPRCYYKSCAYPIEEDTELNSSVLTGMHPPCDIDVSALTQRSVLVLPTRTVVHLELPGVLSLNLTFRQTAFPDDLIRLSRPVYYIEHHTASLDGMPHRVQLYFDASAAHTVNSCWDTSVCRLQPDCIGWPRGWLGCSH